MARLRGVDGAGVAFADAGAHDGEAHAGHDRLHVREVEVDHAGHDDQVGDALDGLTQHVIRGGECVGEWCAAIDGREQPFVRDGDHRVDGVAQFVESAFGGRAASFPFEAEGACDDRDGEGAELGGESGDDGGGACAGAAAEAGGDEHHVGVGEHFDEFIRIFQRGAAADIGVCAGAEAFGQFRADLDACRCGVLCQRLEIGVGDDELDSFEAGAHHAIDGVAAAAADADDFDARACARFGFEFQAKRLRRSDLVSFVHRVPPSPPTSCTTGFGMVRLREK